MRSGKTEHMRKVMEADIRKRGKRATVAFVGASGERVVEYGPNGKPVIDATEVRRRHPRTPGPGKARP